MLEPPAGFGRHSVKAGFLLYHTSLRIGSTMHESLSPFFFFLILLRSNPPTTPDHSGPLRPPVPSQPWALLRLLQNRIFQTLLVNVSRYKH